MAATCDIPTALSLVYNSGPATVTVSWTGDGPDYHVTTKKNDDPEVIVDVALVATTFDIAGVAPGDRYLVFIRGNCVAEGQTYPAIGFIIIPSAGAAPTEFHIIEIKRSEIRLGWTGDPGKYIVSVYTQNNREGGFSTVAIEDNSNEVIIQNFNPDLDYYFYLSYILNLDVFEADNYLEHPKNCCSDFDLTTGT